MKLPARDMYIPRPNPALVTASRRWRRLCGLALMACTSVPAWGCDGPAAKLASREGVVEVRPSGRTQWQAAVADQALCTGDTLAVRALSRAAIVLPNKVVLRLDQGSVLTLGAFADDQPSELGLLEGALHVLTRFGKRFGVRTPYLNAMVDGTEFTVRVADEATRVTVTEGLVHAENKDGQQRLTAGLSASARKDEAPAALQLRPEDAVQWALYFPQVVRPRPQERQALPAPAQAALQAAEAGRFTEALAAWPGEADTALRSARAGWLLGLGRVDEAQALLDLEAEDAPLRADALAIRSVIQVVRNQAAEAMRTARQAAALAPDRAAPQLAMSHALQALRDLPAALDAARRAVALDDDHALAWARLAELQLSSGLLRDGESSARRALALGAGTPRAQALLGFAQLLRGRIGPARSSLLQALQAFPGDPLPQLGLGLAALRSGELAQGRRHLEIAVMLDPGNAEWRALLGQAYLAERRDRLAATQLDLARGLDPRSPTPWFIDGLRKQRANRPVEAATDYEQALALNDQRAVVRPNGLLDTDRAARTAALAAVWRELGFDDALLSTARAALVEDPQSEAAHRLLAGAYAARPRFETARVSELLQAQLRQSPRTEPIAPQELLPGLPIVNGPRALALQETSPLFDESRAGARLGALGGSDGRWGSAATVWRSLGDGQLSFGHFHDESDGFRPGADLRLDANNLLWQTAVTPELHAQAELLSTRRRGGDITQRLLPESSAPQRQRDVESETLRLGVRYTPTPESEWLGSYVRRNQDVTSVDITAIPPLTVTQTGKIERRARWGELLHSAQRPGSKWTLGVSVYREHQDNRLTMAASGLPMPLPTQVSMKTTLASSDSMFAYGDWALSPDASLYAGIRHEKFSKDPVSTSQTSPKLGLSWSLGHDLTFRAMAGRLMKGPAAKEQSLEPTQFAGFNQVFDEPEGTRSRHTALALNQRLHQGAAWGMEFSRRRLQMLGTATSAVPGCDTQLCEFPGQENAHRIYYSARLGKSWTAIASLEYEKLSLGTLGNPFNVPTMTRTWQLPLTLNHFSANGLSLHGQARHVRQSVEFGAASSGKGRFWLLDVGARYRMNESTSLVLDVLNLFDRDLSFQDTYLSGEPRVPRFQPGRRAVLRAEMRF